MPRILLLLVTLTAVVSPLRAQSSCGAPSQPYTIGITASSVAAAAGQPVDFHAYGIPGLFPPFSPGYEIRSCDAASWSFGDGTTTLAAGDATVTHSFSRGYFRVDVTISNSAGSATGTVWVNVSTDPPTIVSVDDIRVPESAGSVAVILERSGNLSSTATVTYDDGFFPLGSYDRNLESVGGTVTFSPGETEKIISIGVHSDDVFTGDLVHGFRIHATDGTFVGPELAREYGLARITIVDDELGPLATLAGDTRVVEGTGGHIVARFVISLDRAVQANAFFTCRVFPGTAEAGKDYIEPGQISVAIFGGTTQVSFDVELVTDSESEPDETFTVQIAGANVPIAIGTLTVTIVDDDRDPLGIISISPAAAPPGTRVTLTGTALDGRCTVTFDNLLGTDLRQVSDNSISVIAPPHADGAVDVQVRCGSEASLLHNGFTYIHPRRRAS